MDMFATAKEPLINKLKGDKGLQLIANAPTAKEPLINKLKGDKGLQLIANAPTA
ncbi:sugar efflux transporter domain protein [Staphylococcus aureus]|nr:sugar efflux transporter domain protein [Staphylococcus aureus]